MTQSTIFEAERRATEGMEASYKNSDSQWREAVEDQLREVLATKETFTSEDIIGPVEERGVFTKTNSALGAIIRGAQRAGVIEPTGQYTMSVRPSRHRAPLRVWRVKHV